MQTQNRRYFGTDGVRGKANNGVLNALFVTKLGQAAGIVFSRQEHHARVLIGKDTRLSNYTFEPAMTAGLTGVGVNVLLTGPIPTPAVARLTDSMRCDLGVMISASHNPHQDNGIKLFGPDGYKLLDEQELEIERLIDTDCASFLVPPEKMGRAQRIDGALERYVELVKSSLPRHMNFAGMRVVIDCANGAGYKAAPLALKELDAEVIEIGITPDGLNINRECGSTSPEALSRMVRERRADVGVALDGDADRVLLVDEEGKLVDGDQVLALIAQNWKEEGRLAKDTAVGTVMSNLGLERHLKAQGIALERTDVGDRYVLELMRREGYNVGGEQSGHVILSDYSKTGDGLLAALQALSVIRKCATKASIACRCFEPVPQVLKNVRFQDQNPLDDDLVKEKVSAARQVLNGAGRLVVRKSGTEPVVRIMAEGDDKVVLQRIVDALEAAMQRE